MKHYHKRKRGIILFAVLVISFFLSWYGTRVDSRYFTYRKTIWGIYYISVKHSLELFHNFLVIQFLRPLLEDHLCTLTFLTYSRFLCKSLYTAVVQEVCTKLLIVLKQRIEEVHKVCSLWSVVQTETVLVW
jgi:hypothetical protein